MRRGWWRKKIKEWRERMYGCDELRVKWKWVVKLRIIPWRCVSPYPKRSLIIMSIMVCCENELPDNFFPCVCLIRYFRITRLCVCFIEAWCVKKHNRIPNDHAFFSLLPKSHANVNFDLVLVWREIKINFFLATPNHCYYTIHTFSTWEVPQTQKFHLL